MKRSIIQNNYQFISNASGETADIYIDGYIVDEPTRELYHAFWGDETSVSFKSIRNQIVNSPAKTFNIYINSGGGQVSDAFAIHDFIVEMQNKGVTINTVGIGIIASAATYILMSSKNSRITKNSWFMIHNMSGAIWGDVNEIENYAKTMRKFNNAAVDMYSKATGKDSATVTTWMNEETWFTGQEAASNGFVKEVSGDGEFKNAIKPEQWPFTNMAVLNTYNSNIKNSTDMKFDIKKLTDSIVNEIKSLFNATTKPEDMQNAIVKGITAAMENVTADIENHINEQVAAAIKGPEFANAVTAALTEALKTLPENFTKAITDATAGLVTNETLEALKTDLANKIITPAKPGKVDNSKKDSDNHPGISMEE